MRLALSSAAEESDLSAEAVLNEPGGSDPIRWRFSRPPTDEAVGPDLEPADSPTSSSIPGTMWKEEYDVHFDFLLQIL